MADAKADVLHRKFGPLTGLQWGLLVGGAVGLIVLYRKRKGAAASGATGAGLTSLGNGLFGDAYGNIYDQAGNLLSATQPTIAGGTAGLGSSTGTGIAAPQNNTDWLRTAIADVIGAGGDALAATQGLTNYIQGQPLSAADQKVLAKALSLAGPPPSPVAFSTASTTPAGPLLGAKVGAGYLPPPLSGGGFGPVSTSFGTYALTAGREGAIASFGAGTPVYIQAAPGSFTPISAQQFTQFEHTPAFQNTPTFLKVA